MCDPVSITGAVLTAGSLAANQVAAGQRDDAQGAAIEEETRRRQAELARQKQYQQQAGEEFQQSLEHYEPEAQKTQQQEVEADRTERIGGRVQDGGEYVATGSAPEVVQGTIAGAMKDALRAGKEDAARRARMGGFNGSMFLNDLAMQQQREDLGVLGQNATGSARTFARNNQAIMDADMAAANEAGAGAATIGDVLSGAGSAVSMAGMAGMGPSWGDLGFGGANMPSMAGGVGPNQPLGGLQKATKGYRGGIGF